MIEVNISASDKKKAAAIAKEIGPRKRSILNNKGAQAGYVGKIVVARLLGLDLCCGVDFDMVIGGIIKAAVKTKQTAGIPSPSFECSIEAGATEQKCDWYVFVRVDKDTMSKAWILGYLPKVEYFEKATFLKKGDIVGDNKFEVKANCYNVPISALKPLPLPEKGGNA